jgi:uncharacterized membrane-anchored protein YhcB (DUF1043 family)
LDQLTESIGIVLNTIEANLLTEDLLKQSQSLTNELQHRQLELQKTNLELEEKAETQAQLLREQTARAAAEAANKSKRSLSCRAQSRVTYTFDANPLCVFEFGTGSNGTRSHPGRAQHHCA